MDIDSYSKILSYVVCELTMPVKKHAFNFLASDQNILNHHLLSAAGEAALTQRRNNNSGNQNKFQKENFTNIIGLPKDSYPHFNNLSTSNTNIETYQAVNSTKKVQTECLFDQESLKDKSTTMSTTTMNHSLETNHALSKEDSEVEIKHEIADESELELSVSRSNDCDISIKSENVEQIQDHDMNVIEDSENDCGTDISNDPFLGADADPFLQSTESDFKNMFKLSRSTFENLVEFLLNEEMEPIENIPLYKKLLIVLWLLGNSGSYSDAAETFNISEEAAANCFFDVCATLYNQSDNIITWPDLDECNVIASRIEKNYGFPGVVGVVGCRYFSTSIPKEAFSRREHFNAKQKAYCVALQIVCDDNLMIRDIFPGLPGGVTEAQIFCRSSIFEQLTSKTQTIQLIDSHKHILARSIYPQLKSVLTPYSEASGTLSQEELELNQLHENVCQLVDQTLEMLQDRFSTLKLLDPEVATMVLVVTCVIHNFCVGNGDLYEMEN